MLCKNNNELAEPTSTAQNASPVAYTVSSGQHALGHYYQDKPFSGMM